MQTMVPRASSRLSSFLTISMSSSVIIEGVILRAFQGTSQYHPSSLLNLESTFKLCHRPYTTIQKTKGPSSKRLKGLKPRDQYAANQAEQRRVANISRQAVLREQRAAARGDPIRGITTPFVESLDTGLPPEVKPTVEQMTNKPASGDPNQPSPSPAHAEKEDLLNHFLTKSELEAALEYSKTLSEPIRETDRSIVDTTAEAEAAREHASKDKSAREAVSRIVSLGNASSKERTRANVRRIIDTFGRHNTDTYLRPKAPSLARLNSTVPDKSIPERTQRVGPDTGSSEVQIGILTAKIRILADRYGGENRNDKVNKRNLRLLLHRRQKLLKYMEKKERGSERWQNMVEKLGLTEATWKGEIAVQ